MSAYLHTGKLVLQVDDFTNPAVAKDYQGFSVQVFTADNDPIMSSLLLAENLKVAYSVFQKKPDGECAGQCQTCGPDIEQCLSCYNPGKSPLFVPDKKQCVS